MNSVRSQAFTNTHTHIIYHPTASPCLLHFKCRQFWNQACVYAIVVWINLSNSLKRYIHLLTIESMQFFPSVATVVFVVSYCYWHFIAMHFSSANQIQFHVKDLWYFMPIQIYSYCLFKWPLFFFGGIIRRVTTFHSIYSFKFELFQ